MPGKIGELQGWRTNTTSFRQENYTLPKGGRKMKYRCA